MRQIELCFTAASGTIWGEIGLFGGGASAGRVKGGGFLAWRFCSRRRRLPPMLRRTIYF
jgi:hypothetical protein